MFERPTHPPRKALQMTNSSPFSQLEAEQQQRLLDKLAKLKALSECRTGNLNETATAAATMTRIMLEYQIEQADLHVLSPTEVIEKNALPDSYNGYPGWQTTILSALASANHCQSYSETRPEYNLFGKRTRSSLKIIGTEEDIDHTIEVFLYCIEEVERLCYYWSPRASVKRRNDFKRGAANGIATRVLEELDKVVQEEEARSAQQSRTSTALQLFQQKDDAVEEYADSIGLRVVRRRSRAVSMEAYQAGYQAGAQMELGGEGVGQPAQGRLSI